MTTMHCTHSDGSTCEARFAMSPATLQEEMEFSAMGGTFEMGCPLVWVDRNIELHQMVHGD